MAASADPGARIAPPPGQRLQARPSVGTGRPGRTDPGARTILRSVVFPFHCFTITLLALHCLLQLLSACVDCSSLVFLVFVLVPG